MKEIWKNIIGWEGFYQISSIGRVKSLERKVPFRSGYVHIAERIMNLSLSANGYQSVRFRKNGRGSNGFNNLVHRLIAIAFIPNPNKYSDVNHKNGIRNDNRVDNLEWCNRRENLSHGFKRIGKSSRHIGVCKRSGGRWESAIWIKNKIVYLGRFSTEKGAANAYKKALKKYKVTNKYQ